MLQRVRYFLFLLCGIPASIFASAQMRNLGYFTDPGVMGDPYGKEFILMASVWYWHFAVNFFLLTLFVYLGTDPATTFNIYPQPPQPKE